MVFFVLILFGIQTVSFFLEATLKESFSPGIANTAHMTGGAVGWFLGTLSYFRWKPQRDASSSKKMSGT